MNEENATEFAQRLIDNASPRGEADLRLVFSCVEEALENIPGERTRKHDILDALIARNCAW